MSPSQEMTRLGLWRTLVITRRGPRLFQDSYWQIAAVCLRSPGEGGGDRARTKKSYQFLNFLSTHLTPVCHVCPTLYLEMSVLASVYNPDIQL